MKKLFILGALLASVSAQAASDKVCGNITEIRPVVGVQDDLLLVNFSVDRKQQSGYLTATSYVFLKSLKEDNMKACVHHVWGGKIQIQAEGVDRL
jgi:hypothetical protein